MIRRLLRLAIDRPFEMWMASLSPIGGLIQLLTGEFPPSMLAKAGPSLTTVWSIYLTVGGLLLFAGLISNRFASQRLGCIILATACAVYAAVAMSFGGLGYLLGAGFLVVLFLGLVTRAITIRRVAGGA